TVEHVLAVERPRDPNHVVVEPRVFALGGRVYDAEQANVVELRGRAHEAHGGLDRKRGDEQDVSGHRGGAASPSRGAASTPPCIGLRSLLGKLAVVGRRVRMRVVFLSPVYPPEMIEYTRGLVEVGAEVYGVGDTPREAVPPRVRPLLHDYLRVPRIMAEDDVMDRVSTWLRGKTIDKVLSNWEPLVILAARLRERWGLPGMSTDAVRGFRDKQLMKERVKAAGLRVPRSRRVRTEAEIRAAAEEISFPLILKPIAGAGSADTHKVTSDKELDAALKAMRGVPEASCEEYVEGEEFTFDTVCIEGKPAYENVAAYLPKPLEMRTLEWVSPV